MCLAHRGQVIVGRTNFLDMRADEPMSAGRSDFHDEIGLKRGPAPCWVRDGGAWSGARANYPSTPQSTNLVKSDHLSNCPLLIFFFEEIRTGFRAGHFDCDPRLAS